MQRILWLPATLVLVLGLFAGAVWSRPTSAQDTPTGQVATLEAGLDVQATTITILDRIQKEAHATVRAQATTIAQQAATIAALQTQVATVPTLTPTVQPTATPVPPTAPPKRTPTPEVVSGSTTLRGTGDTVTDYVRINGTGVVVFSATHNGERNFAVQIYNPDGEKRLLFNEIGPYEGQTALTINGSGDFRFAVTADGDWTITIETD